MPRQNADVLEESKRLLRKLRSMPLPPEVVQKLKEANEAMRRSLALTQEKRDRIIR